MNKINIIFSTITSILAVIAIIISIQSNNISNEAYNLAKESFISDRRILLKSIKEDKKIILKPVSDEQNINNLTIYFPSKFKITPITLVPPELEIYDSLIEDTLKKHLDNTIKTKEGFAIINRHASFPLLIVSHGYTKGNAISTYGLYDLYASYIKFNDSNSTMTIKSIVFNNYDVDIYNPQTYIDNLFKKIEILKQEYITRQSSQ